MEYFNMWTLIFNYCIVTQFSQMIIDAKSIPLNSNDQPILTSRIKRQFGFPSQSLSGFQRPPTNGFLNFPGNNGVFFDNNNVFNDFVVPNTKRQNNRPTPSQNPNQFTSTPRTSSSGTTVAIPGMDTTRSPCEDRCQTTRQYNPVCGSNNVTYENKARFDCAVKCGKRIRIASYKACPLFSAQVK